jgi:hypothetical protein
VTQTSGDNLTHTEGGAELSLVLGGPSYRLWRRTGLSGPSLQFEHRRIVAVMLVAWLPLLILSISEGHAWGAGVKLPFLYDIEMHARLLVAAPLLIVAESVVNQRLRPFVRQFKARELIPDAQIPKFDAAVASAMRLRDSTVVEILLLAFVYGVGVLFIWRTQIALETSTWYGTEVNEKLHLTPAGWWMTCVSLRWYFRLVVWARLLWQVSRLDLKIISTHPDRCGGLGFLSSISNAFIPVLLSQGAMLSGIITNHIFYGGMKLPQFKVELIGLVAVMVFAILAPLLVFSPKLASAKRAGLREYGVLAQRYVREFDFKWLHGGAPPNEPLMGSADIQSLADMGNSYTVVKEMRSVVFTSRALAQMAVITLLPVAPLLLTMIPLEDLLMRLLKVML